MSGLADTYETDGRRSTLLWAGLLFVGGFVGAAGSAAATASVVAGFGVSPATAVESGTLFSGAILLAVYATLAVRTPDNRQRAIAALGTVVGSVGLGLFWAANATTLAGVPPLAVVVYVGGAIVVLGSAVTANSSIEPADSTSGESTPTASISSTLGTRSSEQAETATSAHLGTDGGDEDDDLQFFDD